jgi:hypothetical protein
MKTLLIILFLLPIASYSQTIPTKCQDGMFTRECVATCYAEALAWYYEAVARCEFAECERLCYKLLQAQFQLCRIIHSDDLPPAPNSSTFTCPKDTPKGKCGMVCENWAAELLLSRLANCTDQACRDQARKQYEENKTQCK